MRLGLAPQLALGSAAALVILGVVGLGAIRGTLRWQEHAAVVDRTHEMLARLNHLLSAVVDVETGARGFALTGDDSFLEPYREGSSRIEAALRGVAELSREDPQLTPGLEELRALVAERLRLAGRLVESRRTAGPEAARLEAVSGRGKQVQDRIRDLVAELDRAEQEKLRTRTEEMQAWSRSTRRTVAAGSLLAMAVAGASLGLVRRELRTRHRAEAALREARDGLERNVEQRTAELARKNRVLRTLDEARHAVIRAASEGDLLERICRVVVERGGYRLAWVGFAEPDEARTVRPVAHFGFEEGYLNLLRLTYADTERGQGPTGTAIRTGQLCVCNDLMADAGFAPWRDEAAKRGYAASLVLPLRSAQGVLGVLNVYSQRRGAFDEEEQGMLEGLAHDLGHALNALRERLRREEAEARAREQEGRLRELSIRLLRVQDEERRRLARELHDTTSQNLAVLALTLGRLRSAVASAGPQAEEWVAESRELAGLVSREIRTFSYLLHPPMLELVGLPGALREYLSGFCQRSGVVVQTEIEDSFGRLPREIETSLFRVVQEGLGNIHRHSGSATARLRLGRENGAVVLELVDAGKGIPVDRLRELQTGIVGVGVGIAGMRERLAQFGGRLEIRSGPSGTALRAVVPVELRA